MSWKNDGWKTDKDGSRMKVSDSDKNILKVERISQKENPHSHEGYRVDKSSGKTEMFYKGENYKKK